jgi:putative transposase
MRRLPLTCAEIEKRYEIKFLEISSDENHIHFLVQSGPMNSVTKLVTMIKRTAREVLKNCHHVKKQLWGEEFWSDGYFASTIGKHGDETMIRRYVKSQGGNHEQLHSDHQLAIF